MLWEIFVLFWRKKADGFRCGVYGQSEQRAFDSSTSSGAVSRRSVAELSWAGVSHSARTDNVKLESDGAGSLCGRTVASSSGIKKRRRKKKKKEKFVKQELELWWLDLVGFFSSSYFPWKLFPPQTIFLPVICAVYNSFWLTLSRNWLEPSLKGVEHRLPQRPPSIDAGFIVVFNDTHRKEWSAPRRPHVALWDYCRRKRFVFKIRPRWASWVPAVSQSVRARALHHSPGGARTKSLNIRAGRGLKM